jgi:hypothetical protein
MSREVKRIPMDFDWPMKKTWSGFINDRPGPENCASCDGSGYSPTAKRLNDQWYGYSPFRPEDNGSVPLTIDHPAVRAFSVKNAVQSYFIGLYGFDLGIDFYWKLVKEDGVEALLDSRPSLEYGIANEARRLIEMWNVQWVHHLNEADVKALVEARRLMDFTARPRNEEQAELLKKQAESGGSSYWLKDGNGYVPTPQEVNVWSIGGFGHDGINNWICVKAKCKRLRVSYQCKECKGKGHVWSSRQACNYFNAWRSKEPPGGEGWQMWETTSKGSPMSPVFATPEELAKWLSDSGASSFGSDTATYDQWLAMIGAGWAMSAVNMNDGRGLISGVEACQRRLAKTSPTRSGAASARTASSRSADTTSGSQTAPPSTTATARTLPDHQSLNSRNKLL